MTLRNLKQKIIRNLFRILVDIGIIFHPYRRGKAMLINQGDWELSFFNADFLNDITGLMLYSLSCGYIPVVDLKDRKPGYINYTTFFEQPYGYGDIAKICHRTYGDYDYGYHVTHKKSDLRRWCKIYNRLVKLNRETRAYCDAEYNALIQPEWRVLGVIVRGTDFLTDPNPGLPIQPPVKEIIEETYNLLNSGKYTHIYLATECEEVYNKFAQSFPNQLIVNKRSYYDVIMKNQDIHRITNVHFDRENDNYVKSIEYLSSLVILSRCRALIGGNCGATLTALFFNNLHYEYTHIFNLGTKGDPRK